jgi:esterase
MQFVRANGVQLYHEVHGTGSSILCIHGTSSSAMVWRDAAVERLATVGRAIIYDRRGCTRSERPEPYETSVAQHVEDAAALLTVLAAVPAVVIGRSYGGGVALGLALRHPGLVRALVLLEPGDIVLDGETEPWVEAMTQAVEAAVESDPGRATEAMFGSVLGDAQWEAWPEAFRTMAAANAPAVIAEVRGSRLPVTSTQLKSIALPVLLLAGEGSLPWFRAINARLAAAMQDARTEIVPGGHLIDPGAPSVIAFVREVMARGSA